MISRRLAWRALLVLCALTPRPVPAQGAERPQPTCVRGVLIGLEGDQRATLVLRDGAIEAVLDGDAPAPPGTRIVEGEGLRCVPAFLDAFSRQGLEMRQPVTDQDVPPDVLADVGIDMREANRKGIQPAFQAVEALALAASDSKPWRENGFGSILVAPSGELLAGTSALVATREAAARDLVVRDAVFAHAAFAASGEGYPSTLMGYFAQLRQFFLDAQRHVELTRRRAEGRPGFRPPYDAELEQGAALVRREQRLVCEAQTVSDIDRWMKLAGEFDLSVVVAGGLEAWRIAEDLRAAEVPVILTLDWGKEVDDPRPAEGESEEKAKKKEADPSHYVEPQAVRLDRRERWEEGRDCAIRLHEAGVVFAFGTATESPKGLLKNVRELVKSGLPASVALEALTVEPARMLGVEDRLGRIEPGHDATFALWNGDPLTDDKAAVVWIFVDGFPTEFEQKEKLEGNPDEGIDPTGTWELVFQGRDGPRKSTLELKMDASGNVTGTIVMDNPRGEEPVRADVEGVVNGVTLEFEAELDYGERQMGLTVTGKLEGDEIEGEGVFKSPWRPEGRSQDFRGKKVPQ
jgi:hypothetical protein